MERRKFFKSLSLLGLFTMLPKFLLSNNEENDYTIVWSIDRVIIPKDIKIADWIKKFQNEKVCLYDSTYIKLKPLDFKKQVVNNLSPHIRRIYVYNKPQKYEVIESLNFIFKNCAFEDVVTGWNVSADNFCNYVSIQRSPISITGGEAC